MRILVQAKKTPVRSRRLRRASGIGGSGFREEVQARQVSEGKSTLLISEIPSDPNWPNQSPQPTRGSVTSRAVCFSEPTSSRKARLVPAPRVAEL